MYEYGCGSGGVRNISPYVSLENVVISVYYWDCLQVGLYDIAYYCPSGMDSSLEKVENL